MGLVQHASATTGTNTGQTSLTVTIAAPSIGNCLIVCFTVMSEAGSVPTISSVKIGTSADNFAVGKSNTNSTIGAVAAIYTDQNLQVSSTSVVIAVSEASAISADVYEWNGINLSGAVDNTNASNVNSSASFSSGTSGTLSQPAEVAFGVTGILNPSAETITGPSSPWTNEAQLSTNDSVITFPFDQMSGYQQVSATTALTYSGTCTSGSYSDTAIVTLKLGSTNITTSVLNGTVLFTAPVVSVAESFTVSALTVSASFPSSTILAKVNITSPVFAGSVAFPAPVVTSNNASITTSVLGGTVSFTSPSITVNFSVLTSVLSTAAAFASPGITVSQHIVSSLLATSASFPVPIVMAPISISLPTSAVTVHSVMGTLSVNSPSLISNVSVSSAFGLIRTGKNIRGNTSAATVQAATGTIHIGISGKVTSVTSNPGAVAVKVNVVEPASSVSTASHYGETSVAVSGISHVSIASPAGSLKYSLTGLVSSVSVSAHMRVTISTHGNVATNTSASYPGIKNIIIPGRKSSVTSKSVYGIISISKGLPQSSDSVQAYYGAAAHSISPGVARVNVLSVTGQQDITMPGKISNVNAKAPVFQTLIPGHTANLNAVAYPGSVSVTLTGNMSEVTEASYYGIAGASSMTGYLEENWEAVIYPRVYE